MPYYITGYCGTLDYNTPRADQLFACTIDLNPTQFNWLEIIHIDDRGEALYQKLLKPFKDANVFFPASLRSAIELFKIDSDDDWNIGNFRDWLLGINTAFYPHECKAIMQKLMALTVKVEGNSHGL
jgi:hypothetical protein